ncbi:MAG: Holliday junction branch migration DNA helicase RuvB [Lentisphaeria bacterium]
MSERFITNCLDKKELEFEETLRPQQFSDFPGQDKLKERLTIFVEASKQRNDVMGHVLLSGPPGLGKTTLAHIIANARGVKIHTTSGPVIEKAGDLAGILSSLEEGDVLFIDEIHRMPMAIEEYLYSAMEDFFIDIVLDQGVGSRTVKLNIPHFTLIGATTRQGMISAPLRTRFAMNCRLDYYSPEVLQQIATRSASIINAPIAPEGALEVARRSRGTPRIVNNLLRWVRDYSQVKNHPIVDSLVADAALNMLDIDQHGLDEMDKRILEAILLNHRGGPVGLKTLAIAVGESVDTLEDVYEPYLIQEGYLARTAQGRVTTDKAASLFGIDLIHLSSSKQQRLF